MPEPHSFLYFHRLASNQDRRNLVKGYNELQRIGEQTDFSGNSGFRLYAEGTNAVRYTPSLLNANYTKYLKDAGVSIIDPLLGEQSQGDLLIAREGLLFNAQVNLQDIKLRPKWADLPPTPFVPDPPDINSEPHQVNAIKIWVQSQKSFGSVYTTDTNGGRWGFFFEEARQPKLRTRP